jgi:hypothetical protein
VALGMKEGIFSKTLAPVFQKQDGRFIWITMQFTWHHISEYFLCNHVSRMPITSFSCIKIGFWDFHLILNVCVFTFGIFHFI